MAKFEFSVSEKLLNNKDVNHLFRYSSKLTYILDNIEQKGFFPSYCKEIFPNEIILIPMVSFCNIPITQVENYMYYGDYGIGFTIDWAIENKISPVIYVHGNSDFSNLATEVNKAITRQFVINLFNEELDKKLEEEKILSQNSISNNSSFKNEDMFKINQLAIANIQFTKFWKNEISFDVSFKEFEYTHKYNKIINSYNEREWRYIPNLDNDDFFSKIIEKTRLNSESKIEDNPEFTKYYSSKTRKPHIRGEKYLLKFNLEDLRYIVVKNSNEIILVINQLGNYFGETNVYNRIKGGQLLVLTKENILNDF